LHFAIFVDDDAESLVVFLKILQLGEDVRVLAG